VPYATKVVKRSTREVMSYYFDPPLQLDDQPTSDWSTHVYSFVSTSSPSSTLLHMEECPNQTLFTPVQGIEELPLSSCRESFDSTHEIGSGSNNQSSHGAAR
jgi:hypothetical protein